jgi:hypothetical protein
MIGPKRYISLYEKYSGLLSGEADKDKERFLSGKPPLKGSTTTKHFFFQQVNRVKGDVQIFLRVTQP